MRETESGYVRMKELAFDLGVSVRTIYRWIDKSMFPQPYTLGDNSIGFLISEIEAWKKGRPVRVMVPRRKPRNNNPPTAA